VDAYHGHGRDAGSVSTCRSAPNALCETADGAFFPSPGDNAIEITGQANPLFGSIAFSRIAWEARAACNGQDGRGQGRVLVKDRPVYTVSACDALQGHLVTTYRPHLEEVTVQGQTLGSMAYTVMLVASLVAIYGASGDQGESWQESMVIIGACWCGVLGCCFVHVVSGIHFLTREDEIHFWMSVTGVALSTVRTEPSAGRVSDICICMLCTVTDTLYRTPETPYASIFTCVMALRMWSKVRTVCTVESGAWLHVDAVFTVLFMCLTIETGLVPQYEDREDWPIYGGVGVFITYFAAQCGAKPCGKG
jgi:hypothetical protein